MTNDELEAEVKKLKQRLSAEIDSRTRDNGVYNQAIASLRAENINLSALIMDLGKRVQSLENRQKEKVIKG